MPITLIDFVSKIITQCNEVRRSRWWGEIQKTLEAAAWRKRDEAAQ